MSDVEPIGDEQNAAAPQQDAGAAKPNAAASQQSGEPTQSSPVRSFLKRKNIEISFKRYAIDAMSAMAQGLFASLLIGTIFNTVGNLSGLTFFNELGGYCTAMAGPAMAVAIGYALKADPLVLFSLLAVGHASNTLGGAGGPLAVLVVAIVAAELGKAVSKETKVDIIVTPAVTVGLGVAFAMLVAPPIGALASSVGGFIMWATELQPLLMGILVSVVVGVCLTLPISSAAICAALGLTGLAGGAALAGCCAQMVGFAVASFKDNGWGGVVSQGIGTSMLQMGNIMRKPIVWLAPTLASAVTGPIATCVFALQQNGPAIASGMGTCGLVGPIGVYSGWVDAGVSAGVFEWAGLILVCLVLPAVLTWVFAMLMRKANLLLPGDLKLEQ